MDFVSFYKDKTILLTGATGFLGKTLIEKIFRSMPEFKCIYAIIRPKKAININERLEQEVFQSEIFE